MAASLSFCVRSAANEKGRGLHITAAAAAMAAASTGPVMLAAMSMVIEGAMVRSAALGVASVYEYLMPYVLVARRPCLLCPGGAPQADTCFC